MRSGPKRGGRASRSRQPDASHSAVSHRKPGLSHAAGTLILLAALVWTLGDIVVAGPAARAQGPVAVFKNPKEVDLWIGGTDVVIAEAVTNIGAGRGLGAFSFAFLYSSQIVDVSVSKGPFLSSTGRSTNCFSVRFERGVQFGCTSGGIQPGPTGSGVLAFITVRPRPGLQWRPTAGNGAVAVMDDLENAASLADIFGESISVDQVGDAFVRVRALEGDLNRDCVVNVIDEQMISYRFQATFGVFPYSDFFDLEPSLQPDGDIDIKDLQFVFGRDGRRCEGMPPTPTPTPTVTGTPATVTPTVTGTPATVTPTVTGTPATVTPTVTRTPVTVTPTVTGTPVTVTPTVTGTPVTVTPTVTGTPVTVTPTVTGTPVTVTPTVTGTPVTATATVVRTATPPPTETELPPVLTPFPTIPGGGPPTAVPVRTGTATPEGRVLPGATRPAALPRAGEPGEQGAPSYLLAVAVLAGVGLALLIAGLVRGMAKPDR